MSDDREKEELRQRVRDEIQVAQTAGDEWLLVHLTPEPDRISYGADTRFAGFANHRELRGPRWRTLENARAFRDLGYSWVVAGPLTMGLVARQLLERRVPAGLIVHADAVTRWMPELAVPRPVMNSVEGYLDPTIKEYQHLGAKKPGRATRKRLKKPCFYCSATENLTLHHLIRREWGGATEEANLVSLCRECHDKVHAGLIDDSDLINQVVLRRVQHLVERVRAESSSRRSTNEASGRTRPPPT